MFQQKQKEEGASKMRKRDRGPPHLMRVPVSFSVLTQMTELPE